MSSNLTPWKPGQSGNPSGRPKKQPLSELVLMQLDKPIPASMKEKLPPIFTEVYGPEPTFGDMLAFQLIATAAKGDMSAMNTVFDRVEGKTVQGIKMSGEVITKVVVNI